MSRKFAKRSTYQFVKMCFWLLCGVKRFTYHEELDCIGDVHKPNRRLVPAWETPMNKFWSTRDFSIFFDKGKIVSKLKRNLEVDGQWICVSPGYFMYMYIILYLAFLSPWDAPLGRSISNQTWKKMKQTKILKWIANNSQNRNCVGSIYIGNWNILQRIASSRKKTPQKLFII